LQWRDNGGGRIADKVRPEAVEAKAKQAVAEFQAHKQAQTAHADLLAKSWTRRRQANFPHAPERDRQMAVVTLKRAKELVLSAWAGDEWWAGGPESMRRFGTLGGSPPG
jgi:hypothetical protein